MYWNKVSKLQAADGELRYKTLPTVIKFGLVLAQTNAESECNLSVKVRIVTKDSTFGRKDNSGPTCY